MADKTIGELKRATSLDDDSLLIAEQQGEAVSLPGSLFKQFVKDAADEQVGAAEQYAEDAKQSAEEAKTAVDGIGTAVEDTKNNAQAAEDARKAIEDMIVEAVTLATGTPASVTKEIVDGVVKLVFGLPSGDKGDKGDPGNSIQSITRTAGNGAPGTTDTYTVTLTDGSTTEFYVYNGKDGMGSGDMSASVYDPQGKATDIFKYVDDATANIDPDVTADEVTFSDGETFQQKYDKGELTGPAGANGPAGADGAPATIKGVNALTIEAGDGVEMEQVGGTLTLSATAHGSGVTVYTATIGTSWTEDSNTGVKSQNVAIDGVTASNTATVDHVFIDGTEYGDFVEAENQYLTYITNGYAETYDGGVTFHIFGDAPTVAIPIVVEVV